MIITEQKPILDLEKKIEPFNNIVIIGCAECAAICQTGGTDQVKEIAEHFTGKGKTVLGTLMIDSPCDERISKRDTKLLEKEIKDADALLLLTCGLGCQSLGKITDKKYIPALNTLFYGRLEKLGKYHEACAGCDDCVLFENDGKCPVVLRKVCKDCGRVLKYDSKFCDQCKSENLQAGEARILVVSK
ncbi:MAG: methylenetetrahydrofolate reductase C-terminal domain-containing protein [Candidatus Thorarchaeota archaeon]